MNTQPDNVISRQEMLVAARTRRAGRKAGKRITSGGVTVRIFPVTEAKRRKRWEVRFWSGGRIVRKKFTTKEVAEAFAVERAAEIASGKSSGLFVSHDEYQVFREGVRLQAELAARTGDMRPAVVVQHEQHEQMMRLAEAGLTLTEAATIAIRHSPRAFAEKLVPDLVREFLDDVRARSVAQQCSLAHWRALRSRLKPFAADFTGPLTTLDRATVQEWLSRRAPPAKTWNHLRAAILQLVRFAVKRGHCGGELVTSLANVTAYRVRGRKPTPYTPAELEALLIRARTVAPEIVPYVVAVAFCGFRSSEVVSERGRADWADFDFERGEARVWAGHSKVGEDRFTALPANAVAWLRQDAKPAGPLCDVIHPDQTLRRVRKGSEIPARRNGLRSGFISHRLAVVCDIVKVADEAGTSPEKIRSNYLSRPPEREGLAWFAIFPPVASP